MPGGQGIRARTRHSFARGFRQHGYIPLTTYLRTYKVNHAIISVNMGSSWAEMCQKKAPAARE